MMVDVGVPCVCVLGLSVWHYLFLFIARVFTLSVSCFTALHSSVAFVGRLRRQLPRCSMRLQRSAVRSPVHVFGFYR